MRRVFALVLAVGGCDQLGLGPHQAASSPPPVEAPAPVMPDLLPFAGQTYAELAEAQPRFALDALGLSAADQVRVSAAMASPQGSWIVEGGGATALVFVGCAADCGVGRAVIAIDTATGMPFVGVHDAAGATELLGNDRVEALLRFNSPTRHWEATQAPEATPPVAAAP